MFPSFAHPWALPFILLLPVLATWKQPMEVAPTFSAPVTSTIQSLPVLPVAASSGWRIEPMLALIAAGAAFRLLWIGVGLLRLRRIRKNARSLEPAAVSPVSPISSDNERRRAAR